MYAGTPSCFAQRKGKKEDVFQPPVELLFKLGDLPAQLSTLDTYNSVRKSCLGLTITV